MPVELDAPHFDPDAPIRAPDLNRLGELIAYYARYFGDRLPEILPNDPGITQPPIECFPALVKTAIAATGTSGATEPTNATYYLVPCIPKLGIASTDQFDVEADTFPGVPTYLVGTNLAEVTAHGTNGTHGLTTDGTVEVLVFALPYRESPLKKQYVFWQGSPSGLIPVTVSQSGGANGDGTTAATYTYNATNLLTGVAITGGPFSVTFARYLPSPVTAATHGTGYYNSSGTFVLWQVDEVAGNGTCPT